MEVETAALVCMGFLFCGCAFLFLDGRRVPPTLFLVSMLFPSLLSTLSHVQASD